MTDMPQPTTPAECVEMLEAVLRCLDASARGQDPDKGEILALAAIRVQGAIDLIGPPSALDS